MKELHSWNVKPKEAVLIQSELRKALILHGKPSCRFIAGADCSCKRGDERLFAAITVYDLLSGSICDTATACETALFPYIPGLLSFREAPVILQAFSKLKITPDAMILDGHGIAHPRFFGIASHIGLWLNLPSIGCAKSRLFGAETGSPGINPGAFTLLKHQDTVIGAILRSKKNCNPLYISQGHKIDLDTAIALSLRCCAGYRLPEPTRQAHLHVNRFRLSLSV